MANTDITVSNNGTPSRWSFTWTQAKTGSGSNVYQPTFNSNPIQTLVFMFKESSVSSNGNETTHTAITNGTSITLKGNGNAIQMGSNGSGTLKIDFNRDATEDTNQFVLDLSTITGSQQYSFIGNIETSYGSTKTYSPSSYFQAKFGASVKGNITLNSGGATSGSAPALSFTNGAKLDGNLSVGYEDTYITFASNGGGITGNVSKTSTGRLNIVFDSTHGGSIGSGANNTITITAPGATTITNLTSINVGSISASSSGSNNLSFLTTGGSLQTNKIAAETGGSNTITLTPSQALNLSAEITVTGGKNNLVFKGTQDITLTGNITSQGHGGHTMSNTFALTGANVTLGEEDKKISIKSNTGDQGGWGTLGLTLVYLNGSTTNKVYLNELSIGTDGKLEGDYPKTFNILDFDGSGTNTLVIDKIFAQVGSNVIGKNYLETNSTTGIAQLKKTYKTDGSSQVIDTNNSLFDSEGRPIIANFMKSDNSATFDTLSIGDVTANVFGRNFINITGDLQIKTLTANEGSNYIRASSLTITGGDAGSSTELLGYGGGNYLIIGATNKNTGIGCDIKAQAYSGRSGYNTLALSGDAVTLGTSESARINITADGTLSNHNAWGANYIQLKGSTNNTLYLDNLTIQNNDYRTGETTNILSFDNASATNTLYVNVISAQGGSNIIGKNYLTNDASGNAILNTSLFTSTSQKGYTANSTGFMENANSVKLNNELSVKKITSSESGNNYINLASKLKITGIDNDTALITANKGNNYINASGITFASATSNDFSTYAGKNVLYIGDSGITTESDTLLNFSAKASGVKVGQNIIKSSSTTATNTLNISRMTHDNDNKNSSDFQYAANIIDLSGNNNTITIGFMSAEGKNTLNLNAIAKDIMTGSSASDLNLIDRSNLVADTLMSDTYAVSGVLSITDGMKASTGQNIISYKATSSANSTIINANSDTGDAISGNASIYLNVSASNIENGVSAIQTYLSSSSTDAYSTLANNAVIAGDIVTSGTTNIKIIGTQNTTKTIQNGSQIGILGNITTNSGTTNIVLQDAFFAPSEMIVTGGTPYGVSTNSLTAPTIIGGSNAGNITTANGAVTNVVTRFTQSPAGNGYSLYNVNNQGSGKTNIVLQGDYKIGANVNYGGSYDGEVNMIFATSNNISNSSPLDSGKVANDTFATNMTGGGASTDASVGRVAGVTYSDGLKLTLKDKSIKVGDNDVSFVNTYGHYFTAINNGNVSTFTLDREISEDIVNINGLVLGSISPLSDSASKHFNVTINESSAYVGSVDLANGSSVTLTMKQGSKLLTDSDIFYVRKLALADNNTFSVEGLALNTFAQNNTIIDLATMGSDLGNVTTREQFRLFAVGEQNASAQDSGLQGSGALFRVYVNDKADQTKDTTTLGGYKANSGTNGYFYSDRIIIADTGDLTSQGSKINAQTHYIQVVADSNTNLNNIHYNASLDQSGKSGTAIEGNIAVATVKNDTTNITQTQENQTQALVVFKAQDTIQGFDQVVTTLIAQTTDQYGMTGSGLEGWTTYFVNSMNTKGATSERAETSAATLATNYDLYMANFNSLNKRMGELRENDHSQGVWARVFNGSQSNEFGLGTKTSYTTIQGGYDYAFGFEGANNYLGVALSYSMSNSEVQNSLTQAINDENIGFDNVKSNAVEVAIYNSYVQDEGWYNDSIAKFSYIMSDFNIFGQDTTYNTNNMAFTLSDEFGYRFKLGSEKEWMIDPQLEVAFGYFDQTELKQTLGGSWLNTLADSVITMRSRFGSSFGYDFKKFTQNKAIKASVYVGAFYEYDYVTGGEVKLTTNLGGETTSSSAISSDGRVVMNVGTNVEIYDNTRIYFDFEKSFGGDITTEYQVNLGVRYSFGESNGYTPAVAKAKEVAPLKVEEVKNTQENQAQESKTTQESK